MTDIQVKLRWNILVAALKNKRSAKLDHMQVISATLEKIVVLNNDVKIEILKKNEFNNEIRGLKFQHTKPSYYNDKGLEILGNRNPCTL